MVIGKLSGMLKKKEETSAPEASSEDDPPDELPPLAEDVAEAAAPAEEKPSEEAAATETVQAEATVAPEEAPQPEPAPAVEETPDELPDIQIGEEEAPADDKPAEEQPAEEKSPEEIPDEIKKAQAAKEADKPAVEEEEDQLPAPQVDQPETMEEGSASFFYSLQSHLLKQDEGKDKLLAGDLFERMNNYWQLKREEVKSGAAVTTEDRIEGSIQETLAELQDLEKKWQTQKMAIEEDVKFLEQREREIKIKVEELKQYTNELALFKTVRPEHYFRLKNGVVLKSLHDMVDMLEVVDDETLSHHVEGSSHDFAEWVRHVFHDDQLADRLSDAKTRVQIIRALETTPLIEHHKKSKLRNQVQPFQYFFLGNGVVIKSLTELVDALKIMDMELFDRHVTAGKNDFAHWIITVLKEPELGKQVQSCHTREEMIEAVSVFL